LPTEVSQGWNAGGRQEPPIYGEQRSAEVITSFKAYVHGDAPNLVCMDSALFYAHDPRW
jgi:hypothetical protein